MSALYENQGREQALQPDELVCRDEWMELTGPAPVMCVTCRLHEPEDGADQCNVCLEWDDYEERGPMDLEDQLDELLNEKSEAA